MTPSAKPAPMPANGQSGARSRCRALRNRPCGVEPNPGMRSGLHVRANGHRYGVPTRTCSRNQNAQQTRHQLRRTEPPGLTAIPAAGGPARSQCKTMQEMRLTGSGATRRPVNAGATEATPSEQYPLPQMRTRNIPMRVRYIFFWRPRRRANESWRLLARRSPVASCPIRTSRRRPQRQHAAHVVRAAAVRSDRGQPRTYAVVAAGPAPPNPCSLWTPFIAAR